MRMKIGCTNFMCIEPIYRMFMCVTTKRFPPVLVHASSFQTFFSFWYNNNHCVYNNIHCVHNNIHCVHTAFCGLPTPFFPPFSFPPFSLSPLLYFFSSLSPVQGTPFPLLLPPPQPPPTPLLLPFLLLSFFFFLSRGLLLPSPPLRTWPPSPSPFATASPPPSPPPQVPFPPFETLPWPSSPYVGICISYLFLWSVGLSPYWFLLLYHSISYCVGLSHVLLLWRE